ncbi:heme NO-binding domain-containing protein [Alloalcanivorax venustensis]|uniref:heme NO-binding domain-containing protein n=1 Tax=Alloalcanivorax venustensis TaxID=172371 RepID=UPI0035180EE1
MHGVILYHLRQFAVERFGPDCWDNAQAAAGLEDLVYVPVRLYPDGDMDALVAALEDETALHRNDLLEAFGKWVIPPLINMYRALIPRHWNARDFLLNVEEQVHQKVVRLKDPEARPPRIEVRELAPGVLEIGYRSHRDMSALALGAVHGVAGYFGETAELMEDASGDGQRRFVVRLVPAQRKASLSAV